MIVTTMDRKPVSLPLATVTRAQAVDGGWIVTDALGEEHEVSKIAWDVAVEGTPAATIPALPGTYLLETGQNEEGAPEVWKHNVLGWMISADTQVRPIVLDPEALLSPPWQVLHPDGRVERCDGQTWDNLTDWRVEMLKMKTVKQEN